MVASLAAMVGGVRLLSRALDRAYVGFALITLGAVCLGAWIALLANTGYRGRPLDHDGDE